jgi:hypothetical protein
MSDQSHIPAARAGALFGAKRERKPPLTLRCAVALYEPTMRPETLPAAVGEAEEAEALALRSPGGAASRFSGALKR